MKLREKILIKRIANWLVKTGCKKTLSGNYHISFEDTAEQFNVSIDFILENKELIATKIDEHKEILSETWIDEDFDMNFCGDFE